ncbi:MAG: protein translocase subunit SecF [Candidatus Gracilibacteria bacterium]|nr:protein translocase subunit SecF [Candidatus Gracilibacteria bacterium]
MIFNFIKNRKKFYSVSITTTLIAIIALFTLPLNLGIDMTGGVQAEYNYSDKVDMNEVSKILNDTKSNIKFEGKELINTVTAYKVSGENKFVIEAGLNQIDNLDIKKLEELKISFKDELSKKLTSMESSISLTRYVNIGESFGAYIKQTAYITLFLTIVFISIYLAWAFRGSIEGFSSFPFAGVTIITLFHDVLVALGFYLITSFFFPEFKVDTFFITAMLTVLGYSVSDTIVIMDRIRSNLKNKLNKKLDFGSLVNNAINETLARSLFTSFTVFLTLVAMFFFGPITIKGFILAMMYGTIFGTYSSIAIAAPLLYDISGKK